MRSIASEINKSVDTLERAHKIMEIKATVTGIPFELLEPSRHFVKAGQIHKITSKFVLIDQYYLFNDLLMYCGRPYGGTGSMYYKVRLTATSKIASPLFSHNKSRATFP